MPPQLPVNERFFDKESKEMWYVLGVSFGRYFPSRIDNTNTWSSSSRRLVGIVQEQLEAEHPIIGPEYVGTYKLRIGSDNIHDKLSEWGCIPGKENRRFPDGLGPLYLSNFVRGFFDAHVSASTNGLLQIYYNIPFLRELNRHLVESEVVKPGKVVTDQVLVYSDREDIAGLHHFIYRDWEFVKRNGLYLPEKKERFKGIMPALTHH